PGPRHAGPAAHGAGAGEGDRLRSLGALQPHLGTPAELAPAHGPAPGTDARRRVGHHQVIAADGDHGAELTTTAHAQPYRSVPAWVRDRGRPVVACVGSVVIRPRCRAGSTTPWTQA